MNQDFADQLTAWHDFYAATAAASATLLGLLFVALALNPRILRSWRTPALRAVAGMTFHNFLVVLTISLVALIPETSPTGIYVTLAALGIQGLYRLGRDRVQIDRDPDPRWRGPARLGWTLSLVVANITCLWVAVDLFLGVADSFDWLVLAIFILVTYAAASCLDLLGEIGALSDDFDSAPPPVPNEQPPAPNEQAKS